MKKILLSILSIFAVVALVSGATYALFTDTASVTGITFATGNADLHVSADGGATYATDTVVSGTDFDFTGLVPGSSGSVLAVAGVQGVGLSNSGVVNLDVVGSAVFTLTGGSEPPASSEWGQYLTMALVPAGSATAPSDFVTLDDWVAGNVPVLPTPLPAGAAQLYDFYWNLDSAAGNAIAGSSVDVDFTFDGTQAP